MKKPFCDICRKQISSEQSQISVLTYFAQAGQRGLQPNGAPSEDFCKECLPKGITWWFETLPKLNKQAQDDLDRAKQKSLKKLKDAPFKPKAVHESQPGARPN